MKKLALIVSLLVSTASTAAELQNYTEVKNAVIAGKRISTVFDFEKCTSANKEMVRSAPVGVFMPNALAVTVTGTIATSFNHFTLNNPGFPQKPVYEFIRLGINEDNSVNLDVQVLDAATYKAISGKSAYKCQLQTGVKIYSL
jgi:hypothetical protein